MAFETLQPELRNIGPVVAGDLNPEQYGLLERLDGFEAPYLQERLLKKGTFKNEQEYRQHFNEFKKYVALTQIHQKPVAMASENVDEVWHQFILFTKQYMQFCDENFGKYLHHTPDTSETPLPKDSGKNFRELYQKTFGELPSLWTARDSADCDGECSPGDCCTDTGCDGRPGDD